MRRLILSFALLLLLPVVTLAQTIWLDCPTDITVSPSFGGASADTWNAITAWNSRGIFVVDGGEDRSDIKPVRTTLPLDETPLWTILGAHIRDYDLFYELADVTAVCPFSTADPPETWETWGTFGQSHRPVEINGVWYRSNNYGQQGERVIGTQDTSLANANWTAWTIDPDTANTGVQAVISVEEFQAIQAEEQAPLAVGLNRDPDTIKIRRLGALVRQLWRADKAQ